MSDANLIQDAIIRHDAKRIVELLGDWRELQLARPWPDIRLPCPTVEHALHAFLLREPFERTNSPDGDSTLKATSPIPRYLAPASEVSG